MADQPMSQDERARLLRAAYEEAYATVNCEEIPLDAMEINHPYFTQPLRVVRWPVSGPDPEVFKLLHEDGAPLEPGRVVEYVGFRFELTIPESTKDSEGMFKFKVAIYNDFDEHLMAAALNPGVITATYRQYVKGRELEGPAVTWPDITISSPRREGADMVADGTGLGWMRKPFGGLYLPLDYPALIAGR